VREAHDARVVGVMVSARDYEAMRAFYADRLRNSLRANATETGQQGLTDATLATLLNDET